jgi:hypothetical protein
VNQPTSARGGHVEGHAHVAAVAVRGEERAEAVVVALLEGVARAVARPVVTGEVPAVEAGRQATIDDEPSARAMELGAAVGERGRGGRGAKSRREESGDQRKSVASPPRPRPAASAGWARGGERRIGRVDPAVILDDVDVAGEIGDAGVGGPRERERVDGVACRGVMGQELRRPAERRSDARSMEFEV